MAVKEEIFIEKLSKIFGKYWLGLHELIKINQCKEEVTKNVIPVNELEIHGF